MSFTPVKHRDDPIVIPRRVFYEGSDKLYRGEAVCFNWDTGTATDAEGKRVSRVERPTVLNAPFFAGVADKTYNAVTGGQMITIYLPGSTCEVSLGANVTLGDKVTFTSGQGGAGRFIREGFSGRGTARILQTNSSAVLAGGAALSAAPAIDNDGDTITDAATSDFSAVTEAGDVVDILCASTTGITAGRYAVVTPAAGTTCDITDAGTGSSTKIHYVITSASSPPTALAYLEDGEESCGVFFACPISGVINLPYYGKVYIQGGFTPAGDSTYTLGTYPTTGINPFNGLKVGYFSYNTITTNDMLLNCLATNHLLKTFSVYAPASYGITSVELDGAGDSIVMEYSDGDWFLEKLDGPTITLT